MKTLNSYIELQKELRDNRKVFLLLYKGNTSQSDCAYHSLSAISNTLNPNKIFGIDVSRVTDIHSKFDITTAPSLLIFQEGILKNVIKGCQDSKIYTSILTEATSNALPINENKKSSKNVLVYTTPTCSWCNTLKNYLRSNRIVYREIDVASDERMAEQMVKKSGKQGVPQIEINGRMIVGFDRERIDQLLEIK